MGKRMATRLERRGTLRVRPGDRLSAVSLSSSSGRDIDLVAAADQAHLVLFFYPGDREGLRYPQLAGCTPEACAFRDSLADFVAAGALVFGVNLHSAARQREFVEREGLGFELLSDADHLLTNALGIPIWRSQAGEEFVTRTTIVVRRGGEIVHVEEVAEPVEHVSRVLALVTRLAD
jgi:peroxiredoxin Q/BCP